MDRSQLNNTFAAFTIISALFLSACSSTGPKQHTRLTIHHPGKYDLVYYSEHKTNGFPDYTMATVDGREFYVTDDVVIPSAQSLYLLSHAEFKEGESVLDIGTGSGVQAVFAADIADHVVATDINPKAVKIAKQNAERLQLSHKIDFRQGDLFEPIKDTEKFDVILFNIDYPYNQEAQGLWKVHHRFFADVRKYLKPGGRIYYQSGLLGNVVPINKMVSNNELRIISMRMDAALRVAREPIVYLIMRNIDL